MKKIGRPQIEIDKEEFQKLCGIWCTLGEIAYFFNVSPDTIERWCKRTYNESFAEVNKKYSSEGKITLRRYQLRLAEKYPVMAIFLGKQYLGQSDTAFSVSENGESRKIEFVFKDTSAKGLNNDNPEKV